MAQQSELKVTAEQADGEEVGWLSVGVGPVRATATDVSSFFQRRLQPKWRLVERLDGPVLNLRSGNSFVSINLENAQIHVLEVAVDHAYYGKLGR